MATSPGEFRNYHHMLLLGTINWQVLRSVVFDSQETDLPAMIEHEVLPKQRQSKQALLENRSCLPQTPDTMPVLAGALPVLFHTSAYTRG
jgi:hypothetical protein